MTLYVVTFREQGGTRCQCRIRTAVLADPIAVAVQQLWGASCSWAWAPGSETEGRVYERLDAEEGPADIPRTGLTTVQITPAHRRPHVS
jgi:hypothetical protein